MLTHVDAALRLEFDLLEEPDLAEADSDDDFM